MPAPRAWQSFLTPLAGGVAAGIARTLFVAASAAFCCTLLPLVVVPRLILPKLRRLEAGHLFGAVYQPGAQGDG